MAERTFEDSAGDVWQVFEVHRSSRHSLGVSRGLEHGWLAFVGPDRRRLAPFPPEWETLSDAKLEQLCATARTVGSMLPLISREAAPDAAAPAQPTTDASDEGVENAVRRFGHDARARGLQAVAAMMALKAMLREEHPDAPAARDAHRVRRWFVEAYYFERRR